VLIFVTCSTKPKVVSSPIRQQKTAKRKAIDRAHSRIPAELGKSWKGFNRTRRATLKPSTSKKSVSMLERLRTHHIWSAAIFDLPLRRPSSVSDQTHSPKQRTPPATFCEGRPTVFDSERDRRSQAASHPVTGYGLLPTDCERGEGKR
jgi:hypothetical protein